MIKFSKTIRNALLVGLISAPTTAFSEELFYGFQMEQFEYRAGAKGEDLAVWDGDAFIGSDELKLRWEGSGEYDLDSSTLEGFSNQLSLQKPISTFWDIKGGVRLDAPEGEDRWYGAIGLAGLAPQWFEVDADFYVSENGDASASLDIQYELLITNYLILTPSAEINAAFSSDKDVGVGSGVNSTEIGLRLSYDIWDRTISPYIGVSYEQKYGQTANLADDEGEDTNSVQFVIGTKLLF
ncbi:MAG: copper resistance protein B [Sneathiella sp.]